MSAVVVAAAVAGTTGLFGALSTPASAVTPDGGTSNAYGINVKLFGGNLLGPIPAVTLGVNGANSGLSQTLPVSVPGLVTANTLNAEASSTNFGTANEQISAQAGTEGLVGLNGISLLNTLLNVNAVNVQCNSNANGSTAATQIVGLQIGGAAPLVLPNPIPPNSGLTAAQLGPLAGLVTITLNKQVANDRPAVDGTNIDVIGLQITLLSSLQSGAVINVSHAFCSATGSDIESVPTVSSVVPNVGPVAGGTAVTITGSGFTPTSAVDFGGLAATNVVFVSPTTMTAKSPPAANQLANTTVGVTVSNQYGFGPTPSGPANDFTYEVVPHALSIAPVAGPTTGGQIFTLTGTNFGPDSVVAFGTAGNAALATNVKDVNSTTITGVTPPHSAGLTDVTVADAGGVNTLVNGYTYVLAPVQVSSLSPCCGPVTGGTTVHIIGQGFTGTTLVTFGGTPATGVVVVDDNHLTVVSPAHIAGTFDVIVTSPGGTSFAVVQDQFTFEAVPTIASVSGLVPNQGPVVGGTHVVITGTNFGPDSTVSFGGNAATSVVVVSPTQITAVSPASTLPSTDHSGPVNVTVSDAGGTSGPAVFTYVAPPTIASVNGIVPDFGPTAGGTNVTIAGTNFVPSTSGPTTVTFAGAQATNVVVVNPTTITATSPAGTEGIAQVVVTDLFGSSGPQPFTYIAPPNVGVDGLHPAFGPTTGGTTVVITGTNLTNTTSVTFGGVPSTGSITNTSSTQITVTTPPHAVGPVPVVITAGGGTATAAQPFTYESVPPGVSSLSPPSGPVAGGTTVTITGSGFGAGDPNTMVSFGGNPGSMVNVISQTQLTVVTPKSTLAGDGHGPVAVTVTDSGGTSAPLSFTYVITPVITGISPTSGPPGGGETVIIKGAGLCGATSVPFGTNNATIVSNSADCTQLNVTEPAGQGTVPVFVITPGGTARSPENFTYITPGYWEAASDGGVFSFGGATFLGSVPGQLKPGQVLNSPIVAMADTPDHGGYWLFAADGGVFSFGDAQFFGSIPGVLKPGQVLNGPVVTAEATPDGQGYRMFAADGGVFDFGDAAYEGGLPGAGIFPSSPVSAATAYPFASVGIKPFPGADTAGYWLVTAAGGVYPFGNAPSNVGSALGKIFGKVVALATTPTGEGYYMFLQGGGVAAFGDANTGLGSANSSTPIVFGQATSTGKGYWVFSSNGSVFTFGDAPFEGSTATQGIQQLNKPITAAIAFGAT